MWTEIGDTTLIYFCRTNWRAVERYNIQKQRAYTGERPQWIAGAISVRAENEETHEHISLLPSKELLMGYIDNIKWQ